MGDSNKEGEDTKKQYLQESKEVVFVKGLKRITGVFSCLLSVQ